MALSAAERLLVAQDTLRGLEADKIRAEILSEGNEEHGKRIEVLDAQIAAAEAAIREHAEDAAKEHAKALQEARDAGVAAVEKASPEDFRDDYDHLTKAELLERASLKNVADQIKSSDKKADIIKVLRADDLRG